MGLIDIHQLSVKNRLTSVDLTLNQGEVLGIIGPNGAGKSTLLNTLAGLIPYEGEALLHGVSLHEYSSDKRAQKIALLPQFIESIWSISVHDVVSMGRLPWGDSDQAVIQQAIKQAEIEHLVSRPVNELSGGEKARVWLARVMANQAQVLLVDEPVANLDIHFQQEVMHLLSDYAHEGHGVMLAIHDLSLAARYCDRICCLSEGEIVKTGSVEEVLSASVLNPIFQVDLHIDLQSHPPVVLSR